MIKLVAIVALLLSTAGGEEANTIKMRMITHARISDFSTREVQELKKIVEHIEDPIILYMMERRMLEGMFKRKAPQVIVSRLKKLAATYRWASRVIQGCFSWKRPSHLQIALSFLAGGVFSGMRKDIFEILCRSYTSRKIKEVIGFAGLVKAATLFSVKGYSPQQAVEMLKSVRTRSMTSIHFAIISELTLLGVRSGLSPDEAFTKARSIFNPSPVYPAGYRRK